MIVRLLPSLLVNLSPPLILLIHNDLSSCNDFARTYQDQMRMWLLARSFVTITPDSFEISMIINARSRHTYLLTNDTSRCVGKWAYIPFIEKKVAIFINTIRYRFGFFIITYINVANKCISWGKFDRALNFQTRAVCQWRNSFTSKVFKNWDVTKMLAQINLWYNSSATLI